MKRTRETPPSQGINNNTDDPSAKRVCREEERHLFLAPQALRHAILHTLKEPVVFRGYLGRGGVGLGEGGVGGGEGVGLEDRERGGGSGGYREENRSGNSGEKGSGRDTNGGRGTEKGREGGGGGGGAASVEDRDGNSAENKGGGRDENGGQEEQGSGNKGQVAAGRGGGVGLEKEGGVSEEDRDGNSAEGDKGGGKKEQGSVNKGKGIAGGGGGEVVGLEGKRVGGAANEEDRNGNSAQRVRDGGGGRDREKDIEDEGVGGRCTRNRGREEGGERQVCRRGVGEEERGGEGSDESRRNREKEGDRGSGYGRMESKGEGREVYTRGEGGERSEGSRRNREKERDRGRGYGRMESKGEEREVYRRGEGEEEKGKEGQGDGSEGKGTRGNRERNKGKGEEDKGKEGQGDRREKKGSTGNREGNKREGEEEAAEDNNNSWPFLQWTLDQWTQIFGDQQLVLRVGLRMAPGVALAAPQWEGECLRASMTLSAFLEWAQGHTTTATTTSGTQISSSTHWAYFDYYYLRNLAENCLDLHWGVFGFPERSAVDSTLWIGSAGANTPCHIDTYGINLVAQIHGHKRWVLFPESQSEHLGATRIPYEESSIYCSAGFPRPSRHSHSGLALTTPYVVTLGPGDVLYVPRKWWHSVENLDLALSVNTWVEVDEDAEDRLKEAIVMFQVGSLCQGVTSLPLLQQIFNPNNLNIATLTSTDLLTLLLDQVRATRLSRDLGTRLGHGTDQQKGQSAREGHESEREWPEELQTFEGQKKVAYKGHSAEEGHFRDAVSAKKSHFRDRERPEQQERAMKNEQGQEKAIYKSHSAKEGHLTDLKSAKEGHFRDQKWPQEQERAMKSEQGQENSPYKGHSAEEGHISDLDSANKCHFKNQVSTQERATKLQHDRESKGHSARQGHDSASDSSNQECQLSQTDSATQSQPMHSPSPRQYNKASGTIESHGKGVSGVQSASESRWTDWTWLAQHGVSRVPKMSYAEYECEVLGVREEEEEEEEKEEKGKEKLMKEEGEQGQEECQHQRVSNTLESDNGDLKLLIDVFTDRRVLEMMKIVLDEKISGV